MPRYNVTWAGVVGNPRTPLDPVLYQDLDLSQKAIAKEPNLRLCDYATARAHCGAITEALLYATNLLIMGSQDPFSSNAVVYDIRTHYMRTGQTPSYALGWHTDAERSYYTQEKNLRTIHFLFISGPPLTEFIVARNLARLPSNKDLELPETRFSAQAGKITTYNSTEVHRARPYEGREPAWRYFFRATWLPEMPARNDVFANEVYAGPTIYGEQQSRGFLL